VARTEPEEERLRLAKIVAALSLASDPGNGMPLEWTMRTCLIAVVVGEHLD
jgi:hypothetical protein